LFSSLAHFQAEEEAELPPPPLPVFFTSFELFIPFPETPPFPRKRQNISIAKPRAFLFNALFYFFFLDNFLPSSGIRDKSL